MNGPPSNKYHRVTQGESTLNDGYMGFIVKITDKEFPEINRALGRTHK